MATHLNRNRYTSNTAGQQHQQQQTSVANATSTEQHRPVANQATQKEQHSEFQDQFSQRKKKRKLELATERERLATQHETGNMATQSEESPIGNTSNLATRLGRDFRRAGRRNRSSKKDLMVQDSPAQARLCFRDGKLSLNSNLNLHDGARQHQDN